MHKYTRRQESQLPHHGRERTLTSNHQGALAWTAVQTLFQGGPYLPSVAKKWSGNKTKSVPCKCGWKTLIWSSLEQKLGQLSRPMPPDGCWSRFFLFSDVGVGLLVCESNSCACWRWQWFTSILCRQSGEARMELKAFGSRPHSVDMFPDTLHKKMFFFVPNPDNILLLESNKLTNCRLILQMLHQFPTIPNLLAALCVLLQCVIQRRNTCSVWNGNWCWQAQCGQHYSKTPERYLGYFPSGQDYITVYNYKYKWVSNLIHWWVNTSCSAGMLWQHSWYLELTCECILNERAGLSINKKVLQICWICILFV